MRDKKFTDKVRKFYIEGHQNLYKSTEDEALQSYIRTDFDTLFETEDESFIDFCYSEGSKSIAQWYLLGGRERKLSQAEEDEINEDISRLVQHEEGMEEGMEDVIKKDFVKLFNDIYDNVDTIFLEKVKTLYKQKVLEKIPLMEDNLLNELFETYDVKGVIEEYSDIVFQEGEEFLAEECAEDTLDLMDIDWVNKDLSSKKLKEGENNMNINKEEIFIGETRGNELDRELTHRDIMEKLNPLEVHKRIQAKLEEDKQ